MATSIVQAALSLMLVGSAWAASDVRYAAVLDKRATGPVVPSALPEKWSYQGCYTDPGPRTLDAASYTNNTGMTDETCISYCNTLGYIYAGTEYASQCYCDNQIASTGAPATDGRCSMSCTGNSTEVCGGPIGLTLFWSGVPPPAGPSANPGTSGFGFYGCYTEGTNGRALTNYVTVAGGQPATTVALCIAACMGAGYSMAGLEYADECYCDNSIQNTATPAPGGDSDCSMLCAGNSTEYCGAGNRLDVYKLGYSGSSSTVSSMVISTTSSTASLPSVLINSNIASITSSSSKPSVSQTSTSSKISTTSSTQLSTSSPTKITTSSSSTKLSTSSSTSSKATSSSTSSASSKSSTSSPSSSKSTSSSLASSKLISSSTNFNSKTSTSSTFLTTSQSSTKSSSSSSTVSSATNVVSSTSSSATASPTLGIKQTVGSYTFQGCYTEGTNVRALSDAAFYNYTAMTLEMCATNCATYTYWGVEYGGECYCGNSLNTGSIPATNPSDCSFTCPGNSYEYCGAGNRLEMYKLSSLASSSSSSSSITSVSSSTSSTKVVSTTPATTGSTGTSTGTSKSSTMSGSATSSSTSATPTPTGPVTVQSVGKYVYDGCWTEGTGVRALTPGAFAYDTMTVESCAASCSGYTYFGVEYGRECYCGNSQAASSTPANPSDCNMVCAGNAYEYCGAGNRLNVYVLNGTAISSSSSATGSATGTLTASSTTASQTSTTTGLPAGWKYDGCYTEGTNGRALSYQQAGGNTNTVENCIATCIGLGYTVAGMEYSSQCFCDNYLYNGAALTAASDCNMVCAGNANEICGAGDRLSVYNTGNLTVYQPPAAQKTNLPGSWVYQGCYSDNVNDNRALIWQSILTTNNSATSCLGLCAEYGYMAAGMEYGDECYCGDDSHLIASGSTIQAETDCQVPCSGNAAYYCGGGSRLSYYKWDPNATPINVWHTPNGNAAGSYQFLIGGVVVPLITSTGINDKVVFMEKAGTGAPNTTGTYELDLAFINDFSQAWRPLHVKSDIFCSATVTLPDKAGRQLNIGGWAGASTYGVRIYWPDGSPGVPGVNDWQENVGEVSLLAGRWYPSAMVMTNGSVLVLGGEVGSNSAPTPSCEILPPPPGGYAKYLDWLDRTDPNNLYPFMFVLPSGGIFVVYYNEARILDEISFDTTKTLPNLPGSVINFLAGRTYPLEGTAVMMPQYPPYSAPVTVLVCGGSANGNAMAIDNCVSTQPEAASPTWTIERMPSQRVMSCMCALPDGTYLILNGATEGVAGFGLATGPNLGAVLYDPSQPVNQRFSIMATTIVARLYHSEAMLLPDGRVLVSGSDPEDGVHPEEYRVEVFNPPYTLSGAAAPSFTITNKDWAYGDATIQIQAVIPSGSLGTVRVSMMAAVSSTHGNSLGQRTLFLGVSCSGSAAAATCILTSPPTPHVAPPGWYQIFVLDGAMPGTANWIRIGGYIADQAALGNWPNYPDFSKPGLGAVGT